MTPEKMRALQHEVNFLRTHNGLLEAEMKKQVMNCSMAESLLKTANADLKKARAEIRRFKG